MYLDISMVPLILKENVRRCFRLADKMLFPVQQNFAIEEWKKLDFIIGNKFQWNLKELPKQFWVK